MPRHRRTEAVTLATWEGRLLMAQRRLLELQMGGATAAAKRAQGLAVARLMRYRPAGARRPEPVRSVDDLSVDLIIAMLELHGALGSWPEVRAAVLSGLAALEAEAAAV